MKETGMDGMGRMGRMDGGVIDARIPTAAYCRVSTTKDTQDGSYETQCNYYRQLIETDSTMRLVGIYGDDGQSGRSMKTRPELQRLIRDCELGKVKLILTKSISRFARNMLECVETIRKLNALGVTVRFEKENFDSNSTGGELMLGILATIAQEESNSISKNMSWSRREHLERGEPWEKARYGYISVGKHHRWQIVPEEAEIVRKGFLMAGMCYKIKDILAEMNRMEKKRGSSRIWQSGMLKNMLTSLVYIGDYLSNKQCKILDANGNMRHVINRGHVDQVLIEGHHAPIVSKELFGVVQELVEHGLLSSGRSRYNLEEKKIICRAMGITAPMLTPVASTSLQSPTIQEPEIPTVPTVDIEPIDEEEPAEPAEREAKAV
ncbi:MAG: recombinase family protein [Synergistaceae bacterium]|nr:recombinase family protein [Synergistaceae bacterium]